MTNIRFSAEILDYVLFHAGEQTDGTSDFEAQALIELNRAYRAIWMGGGEFVPEMNEPWLWLKKDPPGVLTILPVVKAGSVAVVNNSASITFSIAPAASVAGYFFKTDDSRAAFRVVSHTGGATAATLDSVYTGDSNSAATFRVMKLEYDLATDLLRPISPFRVQAEGISEIEGIDLSALDTDYPLSNILAGCPDKFALVTETKLRFNAYGGEETTDYIRAEYDYLIRPADLTNSGSEEPLVPREHRQVLADLALFFVHSLKSDNRAEGTGLRAKSGLKAMQKDNQARLAQIGGQYGRLYPRPRRSLGSVSLGSRTRR